MKKLNKKGFTMVELIIVIVIIGVLAAVLIPTFGGIIRKANDSAYQQDRTNQMIQDAIEKIDKGKDNYLSWEDLEEAIANALNNQNPGGLANKIIAIIKGNDKETGLTDEQLTKILEAIANKKLSDIQVRIILEGIKNGENPVLTEQQITDILAKLPQVGITKEDINAAVNAVLGETNTVAIQIKQAIADALDHAALSKEDIAAIIDQIIESNLDAIGDYVARIGRKGYETLAAAVADAKDGDTIVMLKDIEVTANQQIPKDLSLDLNGKKITYTNDSANAYIFSVGAHKFAVLDSSKSGSGLITTTVSATKKTIYGIGSQSGSIIEFKGGKISAVKYGFVVNAGATLNVSDGTVESATNAVWLYGGTSNITGGTLNAPISIRMNQAGSVLNVYGGNINGGTSGYGINPTKSNTTINVYGGEITGGYAIGFTGAGTANIENGHIYGYITALYSNVASTINVNGGLIEGVQFGISTNKNTSILNVNGGEIKSPYIGIYNLGIATILDGTISGNEYGVYSFTGSSLTMENGVVKSLQNGVYNANGTINISGGSVIVSGIETKKDSYSIFSTGATSVSSTANIQNLNPYQTEPKLDDNGEVVLDEKGEPKLNTYIPYGIFSKGTTDNKANIAINGGSISAPNGFALDLYHADATITDGTLSGTNAIVSDTSDSTCTISGGTFNATGSQVCYAFNGKFTISGGTFTGGKTSQYDENQYRFALNCYDSHYTDGSAGFTVTGGSFYQFNPENDLSEGTNTCFTPDGYHAEYDEETGYYTVVENN